ncbi:MAG: hypothetical protein NC911_06040, partial [Candidatus Omnitrophica bacterium]|nr:hypothetical protein [Candidatus Omnitrophota bacterium]
ATSDPIPAIGFNVCDLAASTTLTSVRLYFNPVSPSVPTPDQALAPITPTNTSGISLWRDDGDGLFNSSTDTLIPLVSIGWQSDTTNRIVGQAAGEGAQLTLFKDTDKVCWYDFDGNGIWSAGDALWIDNDGDNTYDNGELVLAGSIVAGTKGVLVSSAEFGFAYRDGNINGQYDPASPPENGEGIYFLGRGRSIVGRYLDLCLITPEPLPTSYNQNGPRYFIAFRTGENMKYKDAFSFSLPANALTFSNGISYGDTNLTTNSITGRLPVFLTDLVPGNDTISRSEQKPIIRIHAYDNTPAENNYLKEVNVYFTGTNVTSDLAALGITNDSGVALYRDTGNGVFSSQFDTFVAPTSITWIGGNRVRMTFGNNSNTLIPDTPGTYFFIVLKGSSVATLGNSLRAEIRSVCSSPTGEGLKFVTATGTQHLSGEYLLGSQLRVVGPAMTVAPDNLDFGFTTGTLTFTVSNTGIGSLNWSLGTPSYQQGSDWILSAMPSNGVLAGGNSVIVTVTVSRNGLAAGNYTATIPVTSNVNNTAVIVTMKVANPELFVSPDTLDFGASLTSLQLSIKNTGGGVLNWTVTNNSDSPWITSINPNSGTATTETDTVVIEVNRQGLAVGTYNGSLKVAANSQEIIIPVRLVVTPNLTVNPATLNFGTATNTMSFNLGNAGTGSVAWLSTIIYQQGSDWITSLVPENGFVSSSPVQVSVTVNRTGLVPGLTYNATIRINDDSYTETETVNVIVSVAEGPSSFAPGKIAAGQFHSLGIKRDGSLWAWGRNNNGQLGDGTTNDALVPVRLGIATDWTMVAAGHSHSLAIKTAGTLWAWGVNNYGQLGDGTASTRLSPVQIGLDNDWVAVAAGSAHTMALKADGSLWAWGQNSYGQLGDGTTVTRYSPVRIGTDNNWVAIACGWFHTLALKSDGTLYSWGNNAYGQLGRQSTPDNFSRPVKIGIETNWSKISAGWYHSAAIKSNGLMYTWGANDYGQLGNGTVLPASSPTQVNSDTSWQTVEAGWAHTLAIKKDGSLWAWGNNTYGQLGVSDEVNSETMNKFPNRVGLQNDWVSIAAGGQHSLGLRYDGANGTLWAWGSNAYGQLGDGTQSNKSTPVQVGTATDWRSMKGGGSYAAGLKTDGSLWVWGENQAGQLGDGSTASKNEPVPLPGDRKWSQMSLGNSHTLAISSDGKLWAWGENTSGQLGDGSTINRQEPVLINSQTWQTISAGRKHSAAIRSDGTLWTWGDNTYGQLGDGTTLNSSVPIKIGNAVNWKTVSCGGKHTVALKTDGSLWTWGDNSSGQLGDGTYLDRLVPVRVGFDTDWVAVSAGANYSLALKANGSLWAWGSNWYGQLGDGTTVDRPYPVPVSLTGDWIAISAGESHSAALKKDGTIWTWGHNAYGKLGDGSTTDRLTPVKVGEATNWVSVSTAETATLAVKTDGSLWFWGQLSPKVTLDTADKLTPVPVLWNGKSDINGDGVIDILDVMLCLRMSLGIDIAKPAVADLDGDNTVTILDVIRLLRQAISVKDGP